ncbi:cell adhesion molecule 2 [Biomphalaria pfeifferi]|uniref:Cell adhesion molecule 2 n=1 Tax=Biomphalaria pfeifferi TaxID=112525 RepID=A0AAD8C7U6_BIOPF|nr:cell adhesion molecule 2 [Biomphalaria pfeifferi]
MTERFVNFRVFLVATLCLHVNTIDVTTTWLNDTIIGTTATLQCNWTVASGENPVQIVYSSNNNSDPFYFSCDVNTDLPYNCTRGTSAQNRHNITSSVLGSVLMLITNLQCSDDGTPFFCSVGELYKLPTISQSLLRVKVALTHPTLSNVQTDVQENSNITATCTAVVGYPNAGQIVWKTYQNGQSVDLSSELMIIAVNVTQPGDDQCTVRTQSSATLKANRLHLNISLACFVINQDIKPTAPDTCSNPVTDFCIQTNPIVVTYPVSSLSLTREPTSTLYEGNTVTLKCLVDGNPLPNFTWTKYGDENRKLSSEMDGLYSTVTLTSLNKTLDSGEYNCTASNVIKNVSYAVIGVIPLVINEATTPDPTTTTTITTTTTEQTYRSTSPTETNSAENINAVNNSDSNKVSLIAVGVILSSIIIVQLVVIIFLIRRQGICVKKPGERSPHIYNFPNKESQYDYVNNSNYNTIEI